MTVIASAAKQSSFLCADRWIASSRSLSSIAHSRDPSASRNDGGVALAAQLFDKAGVGIEILLEQLLHRLLDEFALVVEGVADAVEIDLRLAEDRPGNTRQNVLQMFCGGHAAERTRRIGDDAGRLAQE